VTSFTPGPLYEDGKAALYPSANRGDGPRTGQDDVEDRTRVRPLGRPRGKSLYRLRYSSTLQLKPTSRWCTDGSCMNRAQLQILLPISGIETAGPTLTVNLDCRGLIVIGQCYGTCRTQGSSGISITSAWQQLFAVPSSP
jgi:hypothetical protein